MEEAVPELDPVMEDNPPKEHWISSAELEKRLSENAPEGLPPSAKLVPLILFSGGLDSTYLLYQQLKKSDVEILYVAANQHERKITAEINQRRKIINWLSANAGEHQLYRIRREMRVDMQIKELGLDTAYHQIMPWFHAAIERSTGQRHSEVQMAYVMGDQIAYELQNIQQGWDILSKSLKHYPIPLTFPLVRTHKSRIMRLMPAALQALTWHCELPEPAEGPDLYKACNLCTACFTNKLTQALLVLEDSYPHDHVARQH